MKLQVGKLKPNPFRDFNLYPIFPEWVEQLKDSIAQTGYWNGFVAREKDGEYELAFGHHRKQAIVELFGLEREVEVNVEEMPDYLMRQRMFRENVRNEAQDSAVILHDIEVAKKFREDWKNRPIGRQIADYWRRSTNVEIFKISQFIGRDPRSIERVWYAYKTEKREGLTVSELSGITPTTAEALAREFRKDPPTPKERKHLIQKAKDKELGPNTITGARAELRSPSPIPKEDKMLPKREKPELPDINEYLTTEIMPLANKLANELEKLLPHLDAIKPETLGALGLGACLENIYTYIEEFKKKGLA